MKAARIIGIAGVGNVLSILIVRGIYLQALVSLYFLFCVACNHAFSAKRLERERLLTTVVWLITEIVIGIILGITLYKEKEPLLLIVTFLGLVFFGIPEIVQIIALVRNMRQEKKFVCEINRMKAGRIIGIPVVVYILSTLIVRGIYLEALAILYFLFCLACDNVFSAKRLERERLLTTVVWLITEIVIGIILGITVYKEKEPLLLIEIFLGLGFLGIPEIVRIIASARNMRQEKK